MMAAYVFVMNGTKTTLGVAIFPMREVRVENDDKGEGRGEKQPPPKNHGLY